MIKVGFTTTIPVEFILAKGLTPVDLNNVFVTSGKMLDYIDNAHIAGLPRNLCSWIKGLYSVAVDDKAVDMIISVSNGDCSNTQSLTEIYESKGIKVIPFSYPKESRNKYDDMRREMLSFASDLEIDFNDVVEYSRTIEPIREKLREVDRLTVSCNITGFENHLTLVSSTDFNSDIVQFEHELDELIYTAKNRKADKKPIRLGFIGVPTITPKLYDFIEDKGCNIVFNEVQRQFSIPSKSDDYIMRYIDYTYPYSVYDRIDDIKNAIEQRKIDGLIHYVQSFCFRQMQDIVIRKDINIPILTIEGDSPGEIDARTKIRVESFIEMLEAKKSKKC